METDFGMNLTMRIGLTARCRDIRVISVERTARVCSSDGTDSIPQRPVSDSTRTRVFE